MGHNRWEPCETAVESSTKSCRLGQSVIICRCRHMDILGSSLRMGVVVSINAEVRCLINYRLRSTQFKIVDQLHYIEDINAFKGAIALRPAETQDNNEGAAVYPTAAVGVIFNYHDMKQTYFGGGKTSFSGRKQDDESKDGHSDDVTALCVSFSRKMVASG